MRRLPVPISVFLFSFILISASLFKPVEARAGLIEEMLAIGSENLSKYMMQLFSWGVNAAVFGITGLDTSGQIAYNPNADLTAFLGKTAAFIAFNPPPIHTKDYFVNKALADNLLAPRLGFAQTGSEIIKGSPGDPWIFDLIWKKMRSLSYALAVVIIVLTGLLVMLSYKTDPRTTLSLVDFIPKLAVNLILIAFSWPIAGLFVDLTTVLTTIASNIFGGFGSYTLPILSGIIGLAFVVFGPILATAGVATATAGGVVGVVVGVAATVAGVIVLIISAAYLIGVIMAIITLAKRWLSMVLLSAAAPVIFLWGSLPNQEEATQSWFKAMLVSTLTFPAAGFLMYISTKLVPAPGIGKVFPTPPSNYPFIGGELIIGFFSGIISVIILFMISAIPSVIEEYVDLKAPRALGDVGKQVSKMAASLPFIGSALK